MTAEEKAKITDLKKCNFQEICDYFKKKTEERKAMSKEEKQVGLVLEETLRMLYQIFRVGVKIS